MNEETIVESNRAPSPLLIVKKPTEKIDEREYYGNSNLREWNLSKIIQERVNKEDWGIHSLLQK